VAASEYGWPRLLRLRVYYDGSPVPSVDAPLGDFFGVGHGFERPVQSLVIRDSSEGRSRNSYWSMPFRRACRITVTNEGPVGITSAQVVDSVEHSCQTGPFTLQAGESKQVHCSTYALLNLFPITNKAKVTYLPVNVPPGTQESTTDWSSAKACSLLCIL